MVLNNNFNKKSILFISLTLVFSLVLGFIFHDYYLLGSITLFLGVLQTFLLSKGLWWEEIVGITEAIMVAVVAYKANLYGTTIFTVAVYIPLSIFSLFSWKENQHNGIIKVNKMNLRVSFIVVISLCVCVTIFSFLLSKLKNQNFPILDTISNMLDICGIILIALRYKEGWIFWILCSGIDFIMWSLLATQQVSYNCVMMIIVSFINVVLDIWGLYSFVKMQKKQEIKQLKITGFIVQ